jgi:hypothetical protein
MNNMCPVCGFGLDFPPEDFNICPCCGTEFGYDDASRSYSELRKRWLRDGALWWSQYLTPPLGWDPWEQINGLFERPDFYASFRGTGIQAMISGSSVIHGQVADVSAEGLSYEFGKAKHGRAPEAQAA